MKPCVRFVFLLLFVFSGFAGKTQQPFLRNYSVTDGLTSNEVYDVFQDSKGFIWFATDAGVSRYDGYRFAHFNSRDGLPDNTVFGFSEDRKGRIWFRSYSGLLSYFDGTKIICPPVNAELKKHMPGNTLISMFVDSGDTVWLGLNGTVSCLRVLPGFSRLEEVGEKQKNHVIREMEPGQFLVAASSVFGAPPDIQFYRYGAKEPIVLKDVPGLAGGIFCTQLSSGKTMISSLNVIFTVDGSAIRRELHEQDLVRLVASRGESYWACRSYGKGVALMDFSGSKSRTEKTFLDGYTVTDCLEDHEGGVWFTTLEKGVFYMPYPQVEEMNGFHLANGEKYLALVRFGKNHLATLTSAGTLFRPDSTGNEIHHFNSEPTLFVGMTGALNQFLITGKPSLFFDPVTKHITPILDSSGPLALTGAGRYDDNKWCGISVRRLYWVDVRTGKATILYDHFPERIRCVCRGDGDTLWIGGLTGLWMMRPGQEPVSMGASSPQLGQRIDFLYYDVSHHRLWMSTKGSGLLLRENGNVINIGDALPATCRALSRDEAGSLWVATNAGAFCVSETTKGFTTREYSSRNGLPTNDIVDICRIGDTVWMLTPDRIFRFPLYNYPRNTAPPLLVLQTISVDGRQIAPWGAGSSYRFPYNENTITFSFTGFSFKSFGNVHYRFRLIGVDSSWNEIASPEAAFYGLPPGDYKFSVYALNNDHVLSARPLEYAFTILPPWWQTWWFRITAIVVILSVLALLFWLRGRRVRQTQLFNQRLVEMEMTALRAQMSPHFIFNAINSIHNFVLKGDRSSSASYLAKFARLIRNVLENSSHRKITLARELETLKLYMEIEQMRFSDGFDFSIETDPSIEPGKVMVVPLLLQPYVENAIWHGLLHKKTKGRVRVLVEASGNMLRCTIDDDGVGRAQAALNKQHRLAGSSSMGGEISLRRLNLLNSLYGTKYSIEYTDKKNSDGTPAGTRVELLVPRVHKNEAI